MCESGNKLPLARPLYVCIGLCLLLAVAGAPTRAADSGDHRVTDLFYGQALYQYFQENDLDAIIQLMVAAELPRRQGSQPDESDLLLADLFYGYGLHEESRQLFARLLTSETSASIQNRLWFNLARLRYRQGYRDHAAELLGRIDDQLPRRIEAERKYLMTNLHLADDAFGEADDISRQIDSESIWKAYARYNLAVSMIESDRYRDGQEILDELGRMDPADAEFLALRDLANLSLGLKLLRIDAPEAALERLSRVRLEGPLSNQALLASGWAWSQMQAFDKAERPWQLLLRKNAVDAATQEAILAIPANYAEAGEDRLAIRHYEIAAIQFDRQLQMLDDAVDAIDNRELVSALRENAILLDREQRERLPPDSAVTAQLQLLLASASFHREVRRYQELLDIQQSLRHWSESFPTLELMLEERRRAFEAGLPQLQETGSFAKLDALNRQRDSFALELERISEQQDFRALAQTEEREQLQRLERVADRIGRVSVTRNTAYQQDMHRLLSGLLDYQLETEYPARLWQARKQLKLLDRELELANSRVLRLNQISDKTDADFDEFDRRIDGQVEKIASLNQRVEGLLAQQEARINELAIAAIREQQQHVVKLRLNARFELARLYDKLAVQP